MESFGSYSTKRRRIRARVADHMRIWQEVPSGQRCPVRVIKIAETYSIARKKLARAVAASSDQTTDSETPRKRRRKSSNKENRQSSDEESGSCGEDDVPPAPPAGLTASASQRERLQSPISTSGHSSGSQSPFSTSGSPRVRNSSGSQNPSPPSTIGEEAYKKLMGVYEKLHEDIRLVKSMLNQILKQQNPPLAVSLLEPPAGADFPLKTMEDVDSMNEKLTDSAFLSGVVAMFGDVGGSSLDDATRRMMSYLLSNDLARKFNLFGRHDKRQFRDLRLYDVIFGGLKKNATTQGTNHKDAEKALSKWFTGARDRGGNRARGQRPLAAPHAEPQ